MTYLLTQQYFHPIISAISRLFALFYILFYGQKETQSPLLSESVYEIAIIGAPTSGFLVEGRIGSLKKANHCCFYSHSFDPTTAFLGPPEAAKSVRLKEQPGSFQLL